MSKRSSPEPQNQLLILGICMLPIGVALSSTPAGYIFLLASSVMIIAAIIKEKKKKK
jgi:hypothetical protein